MNATALLPVALCALLCGQALAQTPLLDEVHTVGAPNSAVPVEHSFNISVAGTYDVTLVDEGAALTPAAPLTAVQLAITSGSTVVTTLTGAGSAKFQATSIGTYAVHVVGTPGTNPGSGLIGMQVTDSSNNQVAAFSDTLAVEATVPIDQARIDDTFTVPASGNYQVTLSDLQFPQSLNVATLAIVQQGGSLITSLPGGPAVVALQSGVTYRIFAIGQLATGVSGGLYGVSVSPSGGGAAVYGKTVPVGTVTSLGRPTLTAQNYTLTASDLNTPNALSQLAVAVTLNGVAVAQLSASNSQVFPATANTYEVFGFGSSGSGPGSYAVSLNSAGGVSALSTARAVNTAGGTDFAYSFDTTLSSGGAYALDLADFQYPAVFTSLTAIAVQNATLVGSATAGTKLTIGSSATGSPTTGTLNISPTAGPISVLLFAQPAAATTTGTTTTPAAGLFGVDLTASGASTAAFETTQGVGQLFVSRKVSISTPGNYQVVVSDVGFPAPFQSLAALVTRGTSRLGSVFGGGTFPFPAVAGDYFVNFVAQPTSPAVAGTYALSVVVAPSATLQASEASVPSGGTVTLTWSSDNTTGCSASGGGWSGNLDVSGSATSPAITAKTTFTVTCTDSKGASATASASVDITAPPPPASKGGGGRIDPEELVILFVGLVLARARFTRGRRLSFGRHA